MVGHQGTNECPVIEQSTNKSPRAFRDFQKSALLRAVPLSGIYTENTSWPDGLRPSSARLVVKSCLVSWQGYITVHFETIQTSQEGYHVDRSLVGAVRSRPRRSPF